MREICREENMLQTALAREIGIRVPVFSVGMSWLAGPELAAAVSNAGGCGVVGMAGMTSAEVRVRIRKIRNLTIGLSA
jgi:nitronate monooxygenase